VYDQEGDICITSLTNFAMPFIKYSLGDRGVIHSSKQCGCGNLSPIITLTHGRSSSFVELASGRKISSYILVGTLEKANEKTNGVIEQFQFEQKTSDEMIVRVVLKDSYSGWEQEVVNMFEKSLIEDSLKNMRWTFLLQDRILPDEKTGKLASFITLEQGRCAS
jgi:Coenzyme F390 synthetase